MYIPDHLLPSGLSLLVYPLWLLVLIQALRRAPWRQLRSNRLESLLLGTVTALLLLWSLDAGIRPGLSFHFLGVTVFTLMFGWSLGVIGVSLAALLVALFSGHWEALPLNALLSGVLPVSVSYGIYRQVHRYLPPHIFIYIFLCAFLGAILAAGAAVLALIGVLVTTHTYSFARIAQEYLPFLPLYLFPEGMLNGMLTTIFIGLRPQWLKTFDDKTHLSG